MICTEEYRTDMTKLEKSRRENKLLILCLFTLVLGIVTFAPGYTEVKSWDAKYATELEWRCPNKYCKYENLDGIRYCGICGTERTERYR